MKDVYSIDHYTCSLFYGKNSEAPLVVEPAFQDHQAGVLEKCAELGAGEFNYLQITGFAWDSELSPWAHEPMLSKQDRFEGKGELFCKALEEKIIPSVIDRLGETPQRIVHAGYSLAGLFSLYATHRGMKYTVDGVACVSGSLWYPGFKEYVKTHPFHYEPKAVYLSLGDKESKVRNAFMSRVETATEEIYKQYDEMGITTIFELNPGNHFRDEELRIAKGIQWLLKNV